MNAPGTTTEAHRAGARPLRVLALCGSLRRGAYNRALLAAACELAPGGMAITVWDRLREVPHYDADLDGAEPPEPVAALRAAMRDAEALLLVSPEYNHGVPGVLKTAIEWASRPVASTALRGMPTALMGASTSPVGTARGQLQLRMVLMGTQSIVLPPPEVLVAHAAQRFDAAGQLTDEATRGVVRTLLERFESFARRLRAG